MAYIWSDGPAWTTPYARSRLGSLTPSLGSILLFDSSLEDVIFENNVVYRNTGAVPTIFFHTSFREPSVGLNIRNNILHYAHRGILARYSGGGAVSGTEALNAAWSIGDTPAWLFENNLILFEGNQSAYQTAVAAMPSGNHWVKNEGDIGFRNVSAGDFFLSNTSIYNRVGPNRIGADINTLMLKTNKALLGR